MNYATPVGLGGMSLYILRSIFSSIHIPYEECDPSNITTTQNTVNIIVSIPAILGNRINLWVTLCARTCPDTQTSGTETTDQVNDVMDWQSEHKTNVLVRAYSA